MKAFTSEIVANFDLVQYELYEDILKKGFMTEPVAIPETGCINAFRTFGSIRII